MRIAVVLMALSLPVLAALHTHSSAQASALESTPAQLSPQDRSFAELFTRFGHAAAETGRLAQDRARHAAVAGLGRQLQSDHAAANAALQALLAPRQLAPLPDAPDAEHKAQALQLADARAADFDRLYLDSQIRDHEDLIEVLALEISSGDDPALQKFAVDALRIERGHLQRARQVADGLQAAN